MKKKIQISEGNLISLIKRIVLEQAVKPIQTKNPFSPIKLQNVANLQQNPETQKAATPVAPPVATGTEDMDDAQSLAQADAYQKQKLAQQKPIPCSGGYRKNEAGPFKLCDYGNYIKKLQMILGFKGKQIDSYLGPVTMNAFKKNYPSTKEITKEFIDYLYNLISTNQTANDLATTNLITQNSTNTNILKDKSNPIDVSRLERYSNKAYSINKNNKLEIHITNKSNRVIYVTSCNLLAKNKLWVIEAKKYTKTIPNEFKDTLYRNFCLVNGGGKSGGGFDFGGGRSDGGGAGGSW